MENEDIKKAYADGHNSEHNGGKGKIEEAAPDTNIQNEGETKSDNVNSEQLITENIGQPKAYGKHAHAYGYGTEAKADCSHTEGLSTHTKGAYSHAEGHGAHADGDESHSEGYCTTAFGDLSHSEGNYSTAGGKHSHAEGIFTQTKGEGSHSEGKTAYSNGDYSHAEGESTVSKGMGSHAEGRGTSANGDHSHAEGLNTKAYGVASHAEGEYSITYSEGSHAEGYGTITKNRYEHANGYYNNSFEGDSKEGIIAFSIGNGEGPNERSNAVQVMRNGDIYITDIGGFDGTNYKNANTIQTEIKKISDLKSQITLMSLDNLRLFKTVQYLSEHNIYI